MNALDLFAVEVDLVALGDGLKITPSGFYATKDTKSSAVKPLSPLPTLENGNTGILLSTCEVVAGAISYGGIITNFPFDKVTVSASGTISFKELDPPPAGDRFLELSVSKKRQKKFIGLNRGVEYFVYYWAMNAAGVSDMSDPVSLTCY